MTLWRATTARFQSSGQISRKCLENFEEKGLLTLYLALGRCTWTADDGGRDPIAPVLLVPVGLKFKGQDIQTTDAAHEPDSAITSALC